MLQYIEVVKKEHGFTTVPYVELDIALKWNSVGLWIYGGKPVALVEKTMWNEMSTTVLAEAPGFQCGVPLPVYNWKHPWHSNRAVYKGFKKVAESGNYSPLTWAMMVQELGLVDPNKVANLLSYETIPFTWEQGIKSLITYLGLDKFVRLLHKTTYKDRDGNEQEVSAEFVAKTVYLYYELNCLGYYHPDKPNQNRDWRDLYRHLFEWFQTVRPEVQLPATPELSKMDGLIIDHGYKLVLPWSNKTLFQWAEGLDNCLWKYTDKIIHNECYVLGIFQDSHIVAAVEIIGHRITQLYGYKNSKPDRLLADAVTTALKQSGLIN